MEKENRKDLKIVSQIHSSETSTIYTLDDGRLYKVFTPFYTDGCAKIGDRIERKIDSLEMLREVEEMNIPVSKVINSDGSCNSYTMNKVDGISINDHEDSLTLEQRSDLELYRDLYCKVESVVKKLHRLGIVCPDLLTLDNVFLQPDGSLKFIDVDGLQMPGFHTVAMSTSLGNPTKYLVPKYMNNIMVFNNELDKTSLVMLYFLWTFHIDFNMIGSRLPSGKIITFNDFFDIIKLDDQGILDKIRATISTVDKGFYFGSSAKKLADEYTMDAVRNPLNYIMGGNSYVKTLTRK